MDQTISFLESLVMVSSGRWLWGLTFRSFAATMPMPRSTNLAGAIPLILTPFSSAQATNLVCPSPGFNAAVMVRVYGTEEGLTKLVAGVIID
jgi:hypothetical protein